MARAFAKEVSRSITGKLGRFVALAAIVGLGVGFYAGLRMTAPDMKYSADVYHDSTNTMDIRIASTMGLSAADIDALCALDGIDEVMPAYETDVIATLNGKQHTFRVHSLPKAATGQGSAATNSVTGEKAADSYLNQLELTEGRLPTAAGECVISADVVLETTPGIGDEITVDSGVGNLDETLATRTFTVVGRVHSPYYVESASLGTSTLGSGVVQEYLYTAESSFAESYPITEAFVTVKGAKELDSASAEYQHLIDSAVERINALAPEREEARRNDIKAEAQAEVDEARTEYDQARNEAESELADARSRLDDARAQLAASESQLSQARSDYDAGAAQLAESRRQTEAKLADAQAQIDEQQVQLDASAVQLDQGEKDYAASKRTYDAGAEAYNQALSAYESLGVKDAATEKNLAAQKAQIDAAGAQLADACSQLDAGKQKLARGRQQIAEARNQLVLQRDSATAGFAAAQAKLDEAQARIEDGSSKLEQGKVNHDSGLAEYSDARAAADARFAEAEQKIDDAQAEVDGIAMPDWLVMDRSKNVGMVSFSSDADRVDHIAGIFPLIFFLVAALVALTTMTRMVDEERILIGTYKALGYSHARIASKYLLYAVLASGAGSLVGLLLLGKTLPAVIMYAYAIIYYVPTADLHLDAPITLLAVGLGVGITVLATALAAAAQLRESPASLMQPRAPKAGKRILLERIHPLWSRMSFSWKVTARNIFRYKKRFFMTLVGIAGCTALMLTGWGLRDSINDIIDTQYGQLMHYNATITRTADATDGEREGIDAVLADEELVSQWAHVRYETMMLVDSAGGEHRVGMVCPEDAAAFSSIWTLRDRQTHDPVAIDDDTVVLTEKLATSLGVGVGDSVSVAGQDAMGNAEAKRHSLTVTGIAENYLYDHLFVGKSAYVSAFAEEPDFATWYAAIDEGPDARAAFNEALSSNDGVKNLAYNDETIKSYRSMLRSVNLIVVILVIAAALLAYIVLYSLTNINVEERVREIATLKVLGFTRKETYAYIFREILITVVLGCLLGLVLGVFLEGFVVTSAEVDQAMFGRIIHPESFVLSFVLTVAFACIVLFLMRGKLARIDMVESLKSTE